MRQRYHVERVTELDQKELGAMAEEAALHYLQQQDYREVTRNFRCRQGEIDLIVTKERELVFVEVRSRSRTDYGLPEETVSFAKQQKILRTARYFLMRYPQWGDYYCRFDVVAILWKGDALTEIAELQWYSDAFQ